VAVRDPDSRDRALATGTAAAVKVVPDSSLLAPQLLPDDALRARLAALRQSGSYPADAAPLVLQGNAEALRLGLHERIAAALDALAQDGHQVPVVLAELGPCHGDGEFTDAARQVLPGAVHELRPPFEPADLVAALAHARAFLGTSLHGGLMALAYDVPFAIVDLGNAPKLPGLVRLLGSTSVTAAPGPGLPTVLERLVRVREPTIAAATRLELQRRVTDHFDAVAAVCARRAVRA
jgi:hypothetical protein